MNIEPRGLVFLGSLAGAVGLWLLASRLKWISETQIRKGVLEVLTMHVLIWRQSCGFASPLLRLISVVTALTGLAVLSMK